MQSKNECRTETVRKYNCSSMSFELLKVSVQHDPLVGRLKEAECLLDWLPRVLSTCHYHQQCSPIHSWLFWVSEHIWYIRASQASQKCSSFWTDLWVGWRLASSGQVTENSAVIQCGCNCLFLWSVESIPKAVTQSTSQYPWFIFK